MFKLNTFSKKNFIFSCQKTLSLFGPGYELQNLFFPREFTFTVHFLFLGVLLFFEE